MRTPHQDRPSSRNTCARTRALSCASLLACAGLLGGCSLFDRSSPRGAQYLVDAPAQQRVDGPPLGAVKIVRFTAVAPHDGRAFLYRTTDGTWRTDDFNGFLSAPSDMVFDAFVRALGQSGRFDTVVVEGVPARCDLAVDGVVESFHADYSDASKPRAVVELRAYLLDNRGAGGKLVGQYFGRGESPIKGSAAGDVANAYSAAVGAAIDAVVRAMPQKLDAPAAGG